MCVVVLTGMEPGAMEQTGEDIMTAMIAEFERCDGWINYA